MNLEETFHDLLNNVNIKMVSSNDPFEQELLKSFGKFKENFSNSIKKTMATNQPTFSQVRSEVPSISPIDANLNIAPPKKKMTPWFIFKLVLGIVIFALLAFNIFTYFKTGTDAFTHFIGNTLNKGKGKLSGFFKKKKNNSGKQLSTDDILSSIDKSAKNFSETEVMGQSELKNVVEKDPVKNNEKNDKADDNYFKGDKNENNIDDNEETDDNEESKKGKLIQEEKEEKETDPKKEYKVGKNYSASSVLDLKMAKTPGYCYVGTDRNVRTCVKVGMGDKCASGKVFPTMDLCVNPNLKE